MFMLRRRGWQTGLLAAAAAAAAALSVAGCARHGTAEHQRGTVERGSVDGASLDSATKSATTRAPVRMTMAPTFASHYAGLATATPLVQQMSYQLYRNEVIRKRKRDAHRIEVLERGSDAPIIEVRDGGNRVRRYAFRTASFAALSARAPEALRDVQVALARIGDTAAKERIELLRLAFMLARASDQVAVGRTILLADALPAPSPQLVRMEMLKVRFVAMNFYNLLETDAKLRQSNNVKFVESVGAKAARAQAAGHAVHQAKRDYELRGAKSARLPFDVAYTNISTGPRPFIVPLSIPPKVSK